MNSNDISSGVSNCYIFKSVLQEYVQKNKLPTPIYETIKEGPSHKPVFQSTVIVDGVRYNSLPGFFNRKASEQSAAEVALRELSKSNELNQSVSLPVHEMGLCKNLLQEYAQKMNYAIPLYSCQRSDNVVRGQHNVTCTVEIGGIKYIGAASKSKRDAEISAGRTALIAIQSDSRTPLTNYYKTQLTVVPYEKKTVEVASVVKETVKSTKARKARFKRKAKKVKVEAANIIPLQSITEHCQNDQLGSIETKLNLEPSDQLESIETKLNVEPSDQLGSIETKLKVEPSDQLGIIETKLKVEPSLCV